MFSKTNNQGNEVKNLEALNLNPAENKAICNGAINAMRAYKDDSNSSYSDLINKGVDQNCQSNFAVLLLTLNNKKKSLNNSLNKLPATLATLHRDLNAFKLEDTDTARQQAYQAAIDFVESAQKAFGELKGLDTPRP